MQKVVFSFVLALSAALACAQGRLVVCGDDWALSSIAFADNTPSTNAYALNVAQAMMGASGNALVKSAHTVVGFADLGSALTGAGYGFTVDTDATFTLAQLQGYDPVFLMGGIGAANDSGNLGVLTSYIAGGGSVYLGLGTAAFAGPQGEADAWNPLTTLYGITIGNTWYDPYAIIHAVTDPGPHMLRNGVDLLTYGYGHGLTVSGGAQMAIRGNLPYNGANSNIGMVAMSPVPEPMTLALGGAALGAAYRRRRKPLA